MNAQVQQAYEVWKKSAAEFIAEMDNVIAGQPAGGRLTSTMASVEFAFDMLDTQYRETRPLPSEPAGLAANVEHPAEH
ncbi:hypothetical protein VVD49_20915 [Uliginosibacterium sp. H3]|uniref:Uncharacterized protein n=1 Tax=Uliginosibacterium silvisoli TaxID=3114758 RepID=A0ABU6K8I7_9RHOO|nr:hypothetical protein [Uliginosibacterium sp. H3]